MKKTILTTALVSMSLLTQAFADHTAVHTTSQAIEKKVAEVKTIASNEASSTTTATTATATSMTPDQMNEMLKLGSPSGSHKKLEAFVGQWNYIAKMWMDPKGQPMVTTGTSNNQWILGGRFLQAIAKGAATKDFPAFEGMGLTGFDNIKQAYTSSWVDNMSTSTMEATASFDDKTNTLSEKGTMMCPMEKREKAFRSMWKVKNKNSYQYVSYMTGMDGKEYKAMEIEYSRTK